MTTPITTNDKPKPPASIELWERQTVLEFFGGDKPLHASTLYRGMVAGIYSRPVNVAGNTVRWIADECRADLNRMIAARDGPQQPPRRGRPPRIRSSKVPSENTHPQT
jgi:hypothetical protein